MFWLKYLGEDFIFLQSYCDAHGKLNYEGSHASLIRAGTVDRPTLLYRWWVQYFSVLLLLRWFIQILVFASFQSGPHVLGLPVWTGANYSGSVSLLLKRGLYHNHTGHVLQYGVLVETGTCSSQNSARRPKAKWLLSWTLIQKNMGKYISTTTISIQSPYQFWDVTRFLLFFRQKKVLSAVITAGSPSWLVLQSDKKDVDILESWRRIWVSWASSRASPCGICASQTRPVIDLFVSQRYKHDFKKVPSSTFEGTFVIIIYTQELDCNQGWKTGHICMPLAQMASKISSGKNAHHSRLTHSNLILQNCRVHSFLEFFRFSSAFVRL